jgi:hypothetical protein
MKKAINPLKIEKNTPKRHPQNRMSFWFPIDVCFLAGKIISLARYDSDKKIIHHQIHKFVFGEEYKRFLLAGMDALKNTM